MTISGTMNPGGQSPAARICVEPYSPADRLALFEAYDVSLQLNARGELEVEGPDLAVNCALPAIMANAAALADELAGDIRNGRSGGAPILYRDANAGDSTRFIVAFARSRGAA